MRANLFNLHRVRQFHSFNIDMVLLNKEFNFFVLLSENVYWDLRFLNEFLHIQFIGLLFLLSKRVKISFFVEVKSVKLFLNKRFQFSEAFLCTSAHALMDVVHCLKVPQWRPRIVLACLLEHVKGLSLLPFAIGLSFVFHFNR